MRAVRAYLRASVLIVLLAAAATAHATVIGALDPSNTDPGFGGSCVATNIQYLQAGVAPGEASYTVPLGGGTITSWSTRYGVEGAAVGLQVWRPGLSEAQYQLVGLDNETIARNSAGISTFSSSIPVNAGDLLAIRQPVANTTHCSFHREGQPVNDFVFAYTGSPAVGDTVAFDESKTVFGDLINLSATVRQSADLGVSQKATPTRVQVGQIVQLLFNASNAGPAPSAATVRDTLPSGMTAISAVAQGGVCTLGPPVSCQMTSIAPGSTEAIVINARATKAGHYTSTATISGLATNTDAHSTNNTASKTVIVKSNASCTVPKLVGHTLASAKKLLAKAHCALGKVTKPHHHKGTLVVSQHPGPGKHGPAGTRVRVKLGHK